MVLLLEDFPTLHQTFNLVPSLIQQIKDYVENGATDRFLDLTLRPASDLSPPEKITLLKNFFMANWEQMIAPYPRYLELLLKRGYQATGHDLERAAFYFTEQDFLDLQVCFNLVWFDPLFKESDPLLIELLRKGKDYTEEEKGLVIEKQREILGRIIPTYQRLAATGRIELTTTPYYHPILPLLCDTDLARMAVPEVALPKKRFQHPEDARHQIERAVAYHREVFGMTPRGMWPSEGSVSEEVIPLVADAGIQWLATDEGVLRESYRRSGLEFDKVIGAQYLPYRVSKEGREVTLFFRDRFLSDRSGVVYSI